MIDYKKIETFAAQNKSKKVLEKSSSGGIFFILAKSFLKSGGYVCGATYDTDGNVFHTIVHDFKELYRLLTSKYVRSSLGDCFVKIRTLLEKHRKVLFVGTPCQVSALDLFLKDIDRSNLLLIDFVCHGTPDPKFWKLYLSQKKITKIKYLNFRFKKPSWKNYSIKINNFMEQHQKNTYMQYFLSDYILTTPCYVCKHKGFNRNSDITLCDFWGHTVKITALNEKNGISGVIFNTEKSKKYKWIIKSEANLFPCDFGDIVESNPSYFSTAQKPSDYKETISNLNGELGFVSLKAKESKKPFKSIIKSVLSKVFSRYLMTSYRSERIKSSNRIVKKLGIVTDFGYVNFGNKLQNYALNKICRDFEYIPVNLTSLPNYKNQAIKFFFRFYSSIRGKLHRPTKASKRYNLIKSTSQKYEGKSLLYSYTKTDKKKLNRFQKIIFGSDQIWNLNYHHDRKFVLGNFGILNEGFKKISYAASIGTSEIADRDKPLFYQSLKSFYKISCREESGTKCIKDLGFSCVTTLDPTLLLDIKDWDDAIAKYSSREIKNNHYVVLYFLKNATAKSEILNKYKKENIQVIDLMDETSPFYISNQFGFINLIKNAQHVYTDSFHACVFSIIYGKSFSVYPRTDNPDDDPMFPRIENLFDMFGIKIDLSEKNTFSKLDFLHREKFENLKNFSYSYLKDCLLSGDK